MDEGIPEALLSCASFKREGSPRRSLDADVVVRSGVQGVFLLDGVLVVLEERVSSVFVFGNPALYGTAKYTSVAKILGLYVGQDADGMTSYLRHPWPDGHVQRL